MFCWWCDAFCPQPPLPHFQYQSALPFKALGIILGGLWHVTSRTGTGPKKPHYVCVVAWWTNRSPERSKDLPTDLINSRSKTRTQISWSVFHQPSHKRATGSFRLLPHWMDVSRVTQSWLCPHTGPVLTRHTVSAGPGLHLAWPRTTGGASGKSQPPWALYSSSEK